MIDPVNTFDGRECETCGEEATREATLVGRGAPVFLCRDCFDDVTTLCADCDRRIWQDEGYRIYASPNLYCESCTRKHPGLAWGRQQEAKRDEDRDDFNRVRR